VIMFFALIMGYVLGSLSFSYLITRRVAGIDIRQHGSGNAGATNTLRVLGKGPAIVVLLLDGLKGGLAVWIADWFTQGDPLIIALAGLGAILGHNWPCFFNFHGGKGVATTLGVTASLSIYPVLLSIVVAIVVILVTRYVSLGSLVLLSLIPIFMFFKGDPAEFIMMAMAAGVLGYIRHTQNILRLVEGKENKLGQSNNNGS
jgi:glycerol-3-phosphate acyltransferase PlsY